MLIRSPGAVWRPARLLQICRPSSPACALPSRRIQAFSTSRPSRINRSHLIYLFTKKTWSAKVILIMGLANLLAAFTMGMRSSQEWVESNPEVVFRKLIPQGQAWPRIEQEAEDPVAQETNGLSDWERAQAQVAKKDLGVQFVQSALASSRNEDR